MRIIQTKNQALSFGGPGQGARLILGTDILGPNYPTKLVNDSNGYTQEIINVSTTTKYMVAAGASAFDRYGEMKTGTDVDMWMTRS